MDRRSFMTLLGAGTLLTACGSPDSGPAAPTGTRVVEHQAGRTDVPVRPARIAALDVTVVVGLIALGLPPAAGIGSLKDFLSGMEAQLPPGFDPASVTELPFVGDEELDLEAIAGARPDLVLATENHEQYYDRLRRIAPMVSIKRGGNGNWRPRFREVAQAIDRAEQGAQVETAYEKVIAGLPEAARATMIAFIRPTADGQVVIDSSPEAFAGSVAADAGIQAVRAPAGVGEVTGGLVTISAEQLGILGGAQLIVAGVPADGLAALERSPLWPTLPAVAAGKVLSIPRQVYNGGNHYGAQVILEAVGRALG